jgi:1-acyl-sn-glycerol-3-phosphate acyltransferase
MQNGRPSSFSSVPSVSRERERQPGEMLLRSAHPERQVRRSKTPDWNSVGLPYKALHSLVPAWHNPLWIRAKGTEHIPMEGGLLIAANHTSWWDPIALGAACQRPIHYLGKKEVFKPGPLEAFFRGGGAIPVDRKHGAADAYKAAREALKKGQIIGIFPEATRYHGKLGPAKSGVARLAMETGVPIVPAGIATDKFWSPAQKLPNLTQKIYVNIGAPFYLKGNPDVAIETKVATDQVMEVIGRLLEDAKKARDRREKWRIP